MGHAEPCMARRPTHNAHLRVRTITMLLLLLLLGRAFDVLLRSAMLALGGLLACCCGLLIGGLGISSSGLLYCWRGFHLRMLLLLALSCLVVDRFCVIATLLRCSSFPCNGCL